MALVLVHYFLVFDPYQDPFQEEGLPPGGDNPRRWIANPIDVFFKTVVEWVAVSASPSGQPAAVLQWMKRNPRWQAAFNKVSIDLSLISTRVFLSTLARVSSTLAPPNLPYPTLTPS